MPHDDDSDFGNPQWLQLEADGAGLEPARLSRRVGWTVFLGLVVLANWLA